jgi:hypothetical protein
MSRMPWMTSSTAYLHGSKRASHVTCHATRFTTALHGKTNAEPPRLRKMQVFSGSNQHARCVKQLDKELPLAVPSGRREMRRQINAHAERCQKQRKRQRQMDAAAQSVWKQR